MFVLLVYFCKYYYDFDQCICIYILYLLFGLCFACASIVKLRTKDLTVCSVTIKCEYIEHSISLSINRIGIVCRDVRFLEREPLERSCADRAQQTLWFAQIGNRSLCLFTSSISAAPSS